MFHFVQPFRADRRSFGKDSLAGLEGAKWAVMYARALPSVAGCGHLVLEVECELKRQYGLTGLGLSVPTRHWLYRGEFPIPVSIGRAEPPDCHRHCRVFKGREGQH